MSLFRPEVIEAKRRKLWGDVRLAQPPSLQIWTGVLTLLCLVIAIALICGRFTRKETVQGFLTPEAGIVQVRAIQPGRVARVLVRDGQIVTQGAPLIEFASDLASVGQGPALDLQLQQADRQTTSLEDRQRALGDAYGSDRSRLLGQIDAQRVSKDNLIRQRADQLDALALAESEAERLRKLQAQGYAPASEVDRRRRAVLAERAALGDLENRVSQLDANVADLRSQLANIPARQAEAMADIAGDIAAVAQRRAELQVARSFIIRAPITGKVSGIQARPGMTPSTELPLLALSPEGSPLEAHLLVPTRAAGFLKLGQTARLQIEAFPFQRFGFVNGRVTGISTTVLRPGDVPFPVAQTEPVYEVRVLLSRSYVDAYGERRPLQAGMALRADIAIDRRSLWQIMFDPILAAGKRALPA